MTLNGPIAVADVSKDACVDANAQAQSLRRQGQFSAARERLVVCGDPSCPAIVRNDCAQRLDDLNHLQPTLVLDVKDMDGNDVTAVKVTVDGRALTESIGGTAFPIDPGQHSFAFEVAGQAPVTRTFVLKEGEKDRRERVVVVVAGAVTDVSPAASDEPQPAAVAPSSAGPDTSTVLAITAGVAGVGGIVAGSVLGFAARSALGEQMSDCASAASCANHARALSDHATLETDGTWSTVAFAAGGALLAGGVVLLLLGDRPPSPPTSGLALEPRIAPGRTGVVLRGEF